MSANIGDNAYRPMSVTAADLDGIEEIARDEVKNRRKERTHSVTSSDVLDLCSAIRESRARVAQLEAALRVCRRYFKAADVACAEALGLPAFTEVT